MLATHAAALFPHRNAATRHSDGCTNRSDEAACPHSCLDATALPPPIPAELVTCMKHSMASAIWTSSSCCPIRYGSLPLPGMRAAWRDVLADVAYPQRSDHAARGHLVQVDVRVPGGVQLLDQVSMLIPQQAPRNSPSDLNRAFTATTACHPCAHLCHP